MTHPAAPQVAPAAEEVRKGYPVKKCADLTPHEERILRLVAYGLSNKEISVRLGVTLYSVFNQMTDIRDKLGVNNRTRATLWALRNGLVTLDEAWYAPEVQP